MKVMKTITTLLLALVSVAGASAQNIDRLIVQPKSGNPQGYAIDNVDSIYFDNVGDDVAATVTVNKVSTSSTGDTLWVAVTPTADCASYRITCMPTVRANAITSSAALDAYLNNINAARYYQGFTNAQMTGFDQPFEAASQYSLVTLAYDKYNTACKISKTDFTTPAAALIGSPTVACQTTDSTTTTLSMKFTPNADCKGYAICLFEDGQAQQQFDQWAPMFGFVNMGDMIKQFSGTTYTTEYTNTWTQLAPGTEYEVYVLPMDANGNYAPMVIAHASTAKQGGTGTAMVTITIGNYVTTENGNYQEVTYTPNDQTSLHRDMLITAEAYAQWGEQGVIDYLKADNSKDPYWNQYGVDNATWNADPNTQYVACSIARNINDEWGPLAKVEFTTTSGNSTSAKAPRIATRKAQTTMTFNGKAPTMNARWAHRGLTITESAK